MKSRHDGERLVQEALTGARSLDDVALAAALRADPALHARFKALRDLAAALDHEGRLQRAALASAADPRLPAFDLDAARRRSRVHRWHKMTWIVAALLVCALAVWWRVVPDGPAPVPSQYRLAVGWQATPAGAVRGLPAEFAWRDPSGRPTRAQRYFIVFTDAAGTHLDTIELDRDPRWQTSAELMRTLPKHFAWEVQLRAGDQIVRRSGPNDVVRD